MAIEEDAGRGYCYARRESTVKHVLAGQPSHPSTHGTPGHAISPDEGIPIFSTLP